MRRLIPMEGIPLAFVQMYYNAKKEELCIFDEVYQQKLTNRLDGKKDD